MRCSFRLRGLAEAVLRCMSGAARILASTIYTASIHVASIYSASRRAYRGEEAGAIIRRPPPPRGFPIVEQFHGDYAPSLGVRARIPWPLCRPSCADHDPACF
jgi:hypothetical protein